MVFGENSVVLVILVAILERKEFLERHRISTKCDSSRPLKQLWRNLNDEVIGRQSCGQTSMFLPHKFNLHFTSAVAGSALDLMRFLMALHLVVWRKLLFLMLL
jgi:hypothetical protein